MAQQKQEIRHPDVSENPNAPYSSGVICDGWLYISGHGPVDLKTYQVVRGTIEEETRYALEQLGKVLQKAGCGWEDVVKCTCFLNDIKDFDGFSKTYTEFFPRPRPARTTIGCHLWNDIKVEIDIIARMPKS